MVAATAAAGCAARPDAHARESLARADAELLAGCYDCLVSAREGYRRLAVGGQRAVVLARVFEADLLIGLRERELALPASDALGEARRIAAELPRELEAARYLALVDAVPSAELGVARRAYGDFRIAHADLASSQVERAWLAGGQLRQPVREYLRLALDCAYPLLDDGAQRELPDAVAPEPPLLAYRRELCGFGRTAVLEAVRAREPRFVETSLFLANIEIALAAREEPEHAKEHLAEALARFPASSAIVYLLAAYDRFVGDFAEALPLYERTLALVPTHEQAMLGRVICLTNLDRRQEAIDAATRIIERREDHAAEAYYWRARNRHALAELGEARKDIAAAKEQLATADVLGLAGIIEHDQGDLDPALVDLTEAIAADRHDCTARWYLALVERRGKQWLVAGREFEDAMTCYRDRAQASTARIAALEARLRDPAHRARAVASLRASIEADTRQLHLAALAAANCVAVGGDIAQARTLLELASEDPALADRVTKLRVQLDRARGSP